MACELAEIVKSVSPNRALAMVLYAWAWRAGVRGDILERARLVCFELGDFVRVAQLAAVEYETTGAADMLMVRALALVDGGEVAAAKDAVVAALEVSPDDDTLKLLSRGMSEQISTKGLADLDAQAARSTSSELPSTLLRLARLARLRGDGGNYGHLLQRALDAKPSDNTIFSLLEAELVAQQNWKQLVVHYHLRSEALPKSQHVEVYRRAGVRLSARAVRPSMAVRLTHQALLDCYEEGQTSIPHHISMLSLVTVHFRSSRTTAPAVKLLAQTMARVTDEDVVVWTARQGLGITKRRYRASPSIAFLSRCAPKEVSGPRSSRGSPER
ncbi:MAG: hypothetical protein GY811_09460 [Myxococcales bacterium]|nr:hypothetical protein [Myxococcales bacterium]